LQNVRGVSLSFCTTKIGQKIETTKSKTLFSSILGTFFLLSSHFFSTTEKSLSEEEGEAIFMEGEAPCIPPLAPFSSHEFSKSHGGVGAA
jgi:hypothetical protein